MQLALFHCTTPNNAPISHIPDYQQSLTPHYARKLCSFPRLTAAMQNNLSRFSMYGAQRGCTIFICCKNDIFTNFRYSNLLVKKGLILRVECTAAVLRSSYSSVLWYTHYHNLNIYHNQLISQMVIKA